MAGLITGALAITVASPTDVAKIRLQTQATLPKAEQIYNGVWDVYRKTVAKDGLRGLWLGWGPNVIRNGLINAAEVSTYDQSKQLLLGKGYYDGPLLHCLCATMASATAAVVGCPPDVIKTRTMNMRSASERIGYVTLAK